MDASNDNTISTANPYPGLRAYDTADADLFFGREDQTQELLTRLRRVHFLAVVGSSGCGKSSLVKAGLLPALRSGFMVEADSGWRIAMFRPGGNPLGQLAAALGSPDVLGGDAWNNSPQTGQLIQAMLRRGSRGVIDAVLQSRLPAGDKLLIVVDQFEELFRYVHENVQGRAHGEARALVNLLLEAARQREHPIYVMLTMRSEFLANCTQFPGLPQAINQGLYLVPRLSRDQLRDAIQEPVHLRNVLISNRLVNQLLNELGDDPDQLPILQHALMRMWNKRSAESGSGRLDVEHYEQIGKLDKALSKHLEEIFGELDEAAKKIAESAFRNLTQTTRDGRMIRRPVKAELLCRLADTDTEQLATVMDAFRSEGRSFVMPPAAEPLTSTTVLDISHESLIRQWPRLRQWTEDEANARRIQEMVRDETAHWEKAERDAGLLLTGVRLAEALEWRAGHAVEMGEGEAEFLDAGVAQRDREARRTLRGRAVGVIAVILMLAVPLIGYLYQRTRKALGETDTARKEAVSLAGSLVEEQARTNTLYEENRRIINARSTHDALTAGTAALREGDSFKAALWFTKALEKETDPQRAEIHRMRIGTLLRYAPRLIREWELGAGIEHVELADGADKLLVRSERGFKIWNLIDGQIVQEYTGERKLLTVSRDGKWAVTLANDEQGAAGLLIDVKTGKTLPTEDANEAIFSADGKWLCTLNPAQEATLWSLETLTKRRLAEQTFKVAFAPNSELLARVIKKERRATETRAAVGNLEAAVRIDEVATKNSHDLLVDSLVGAGGQAPEPLTSSNYVDLEFSADGSRLMLCVTDWIDFWDTASWTHHGTTDLDLNAEVNEFPGVSMGIDPRLLSTAFSHNGEHVLWRDSEGRLGVTEYESRNSLNLPQSGKLNSIRFSPDSRWLATASGNRTAQIWTHSGDPVTCPLHHQESLSDAIFAGEGRFLVTLTVSGVARIWDLGNLAPDVRELPTDPFATMVTEDGAQVVGVGESLETWDVAAGNEIMSRPLSKTVVGLVGSPDGTHLAFFNNDRSVQLWSVRDAELLAEVALAADAFDNFLNETRNDFKVIDDYIAFSDDNRFLLTSAKNSPVQLWDVKTGKQKGVSIVGLTKIQKARCTPNGRHIITSELSAGTKVWDSETGLQVVDFGHSNPTMPLSAVSPDATRIAVSNGNLVEIWDINRGNRLHQFDHEREVGSCEFSRDNRFIVTTADDNTAQIWNLHSASVENPDRILKQASGAPLAHVLKHQGIVTTAAISRDGRLVVTLCDDQTISVWESATGRLVAHRTFDELHAGPFRGGQMGIQMDASQSGRRIGISDDGNSVVVVGNSGRFTRFELLPPSLADRVSDSNRLTLLAEIISNSRIIEDVQTGMLTSVSVATHPQASRDAVQRMIEQNAVPFEQEARLVWHEQAARQCELKLQFSAATWHLDYLIDESPLEFRLRDRRAFALQVSGLRYFATALEDANKLVELQPQEGRVWSLLANVLSELKRPAEAIEDLTRAIALKPEQPDLYYDQGKLYAKLKRWDEAVSALKEFVELDGRRYVPSFSSRRNTDPYGMLTADALPALLKALDDDNPVIRRWCLTVISSNALSDGLKQVPAPIIKAMSDSDRATALDAVSLVESLVPVAQNAISAIAESTRSTDAEIRLAAVEALGVIGKDSLVAAPRLAELVSDEDVAVRVKAIEVLLAITTDEALLVAPVRAALKDTEQHVREAAAIGLSVMDKPIGPLLPDVIRALSDESEIVQQHAAFAVNSYGPAAAAAVPQLTELVKKDGRARMDAMYALSKIGTPAKSAIPVVQEIWESDGSPAALECLGYLLRESDEAIPLLSPLLDDERDQIALIAAKGIWLSDARSPDIVARLRKSFVSHLTSSELMFRKVSVNMLGYMGPDAAPATDAIVAAFETEKDEQVRREFVSTLVATRDPRAIAPLAASLKSADPEEQLAATIGLREFRSDLVVEVIPALVGALKSSDFKVRYQVALTLADLGKKAAQAIPALEIMCLDPDERVKLICTFTLWAITNEAEVNESVLAEGLRSSTPSLRKLSLDLLLASSHDIKSDLLVETVKQLLSDEQPEIRPDAARLLWRMESQSDIVLPTFQAALASDDAAVQYAAARGLNEMGLLAAPALSDLIAAASHPNVEIRRNVMATLRKISDLASFDVVANALQDMDLEVRLNAVLALAAWEATAKPVAHTLIQALDDDAADVRWRAAYALSFLGDAAAPALPKLSEMLSDADDYTRVISARTIHILSGDNSTLVPVLRAALKSRDPLARKLAANVLGDCGDAAQAALDDLADNLSDKEEPVRAAASAALLKLSPDFLIRQTTERLQDDPDRVELILGRANAFIAQREWLHASRDLQRVVEIEPDAHVEWFRLAVLHLQVGDVQAYEAVRIQMLQQFEDTEDADIANNIAYGCALTPLEPDLAARVLKLAELTVATKPNESLFLNTLGTVLYRAARYEDAVQRLTASIRLNDQKGTPDDWLILAMASFRLENPQEARLWLEKSKQFLEENEASGWQQKIKRKTLLDEAESLLTGRTD